MKEFTTKIIFNLGVTLIFALPLVTAAQGSEYFYRVTVGTNDATMPAPQGAGGNVNEHGFRFSCLPSHFSYDDPVVYPGEANRAHLHMYFGNTEVTHESTSASIFSTGASTCAGGVTNRSAYWNPALLNEGGEAVLPDKIINYYKSWVSDRSQIRPIPRGLQILANDQVTGSLGVAVARPDHPEDTWNSHIRVSDHDGLSIEIIFPDCIAVDNAGEPVLTSPGGTDHVAYSTGDGCPSSHPYLIPQLTQNITWFDIPYESEWQLSSDASVATKGESAHADYMAAWTDESAEIMADCVRDAYRECGPSMSSEQGRAMSESPDGEQLYQYFIKLNSTDATPLGVWPKTVTDHSGHSDPDPEVPTEAQDNDTDPEAGTGSETEEEVAADTDSEVDHSTETETPNVDGESAPDTETIDKVRKEKIKQLKVRLIKLLQRLLELRMML